MVSGATGSPRGLGLRTRVMASEASGCNKRLGYSLPQALQVLVVVFLPSKILH